MQRSNILLRSSYVAFLIKTAGEFEGLTITERGKKCGLAFGQLSTPEKAQLKTLAPKSFPKRIHGHSGFQFYMKTNGGIIDEQAAKWVKLSTEDKAAFRIKGKVVPVIKRAASKPVFLRRRPTPWARYLRDNKSRFKGMNGRQALDFTRVLAKEFKKSKKNQ